jgi:hypothetical protein
LELLKEKKSSRLFNQDWEEEAEERQAKRAREKRRDAPSRG